MLGDCLNVFIRRYTSLEREKPCGISVKKYLMGWCRGDGVSGVQGKDKRLWAQTQTQNVLSQYQTF